MKFIHFNRQPLYHKTSKIKDILKSGILKTGHVTYPKDKKVVCLTRSSFYMKNDIDDNFKLLKVNKYDNILLSRLNCDNETKICFNTDLLIRDGFIPKPIDEIGLMLVTEKRRKVRCKCFIDKTMLEYEERIYKDIPNISKYILFIEMPYDKYNYMELLELVNEKGYKFPILLSFNDNKDRIDHFLHFQEANHKKTHEIYRKIEDKKEQKLIDSAETYVNLIIYSFYNAICNFFENEDEKIRIYGEGKFYIKFSDINKAEYIENTCKGLNMNTLIQYIGNKLYFGVTNSENSYFDYNNDNGDFFVYIKKSSSGETFSYMENIEFFYKIMKSYLHILKLKNINLV